MDQFQWTYEYSHCGGYDCMTDSIEITRGGDRARVSLDMANFGQSGSDYDFNILSPGAQRAIEIARIIVVALNKADIPCL